ncbi:MAG: alpha-galactosidase [Clostridia bacterium]|nr:alpha-galactosidase [Clostridia bacterium]
MRYEIVLQRENGLFTITKPCDIFKVYQQQIPNGYRCTAVFTPKNKEKIVKAEIVCPEVYPKGSKVFAEGFQSWTKVKEYDLTEKEENYSLPVIATNFWKGWLTITDRHFYKIKNKKGVFHSIGSTYIKSDENYRFYGALNIKDCFTVFESNPKKYEMKIISDVKGLETDKEITLFDFIVIDGSKSYVYDSYFEYLEIPKSTNKKTKGFTSWYNYYQNINEEIILKNLNNFIAFKNAGNDVDLFQIDDGYETFVGDWLDVDQNKFPNGLKPIADKINEHFISGLWLAPFGAQPKSKLFTEHPDWFLKNAKGKPVLAGCSWDGFYALDFYNEEVREYLRKVFKTVFEDWGFKMVKLDFLYAAALVVPKDKTRAQVMREVMEFLRELCKDKLLLGCGVPLTSAYGLVDYCRIGCDVSLDFDGGIIAKHLHKDGVSSQNAINNAVLRYELSGRAFLNDPDVFILRSDNVKMSVDERLTLSIANAIFGKVLFTSDDFMKYPDEDSVEQLEYVWRLNDCKLINYKIVQDYVFKATVEFEGKIQTYYINASSKKVQVDGMPMEKHTVRIVE